MAESRVIPGREGGLRGQGESDGFEDWTKDPGRMGKYGGLRFEQPNREKGQLCRKGGNGTNGTHSTIRWCLFSQAVIGLSLPIYTDPRDRDLPQFS